MEYSGGRPGPDKKLDPRVGDKVLGAKVKGRVAAVLKDRVEVVSRGPWAAGGPEKELRGAYDPAALVLVSRAPEKPKK